ncbi:MAG: DegV family EDD domain-containing protein, partial [Gorillibacterium sp.]|nr:DegV family EDD domain-containing protein [Gorillibacterium sp.]
AKRVDVEASFVIDTLDYLHMGGRCSSTQAFIGNILKIRPIVSVTSGKLSMIAKIRGKRDKAIRQLLDNALQNMDQIMHGMVFIAHSFAKEEAEFIRNELIAHPSVKEVYITEAGCVISSHCGPQTAGLFFMKA